MHSSNDIVVTSCLSDCTKCTGLYKNDTFGSKIVCKCSCHSRKYTALDGFPTPQSNADEKLQTYSDKVLYQRCL
jgi:hypothetical protein